MTSPMLELVLKGSVLLLLAVLFTWTARRATAAAQRHFVWTLGFVGLLALPAFSALPLRLAVLPTPVETVAASERQSVATSESRSVEVGPFATSDGASSASTLPRFNASTSSGFSREQVLTALWALGALLLLGRIAAAYVAALWLVRSGREILDARWQLALASAADDLGVIAPVRLVQTPRARIPMTFGLRSPVIVLPEEAFVWDDEARRVVLLHELSHVKRGDMMTCLLSQIVSALYWFNPLVWVAAYRLRIEAEQACDDMVLHAGAQPSAYAEQLLAIVQSAGRTPVPALAMPMAQPSAFEGRIIAILQRDVARHGLTRRAVLAGITMLLAVAVPLAALAPKGPGTRDQKPEIVAPVANDAAPVTSTQAESVAPGAGSLAPEVAAQVPADFAGADGVSAALITALKDESLPVRMAAVQALGDRADTSAINALLEALRRDTSRDVRRMAAWALGEIEDARAVPGLLTALREERDRDVRLAIVRALGEIESADAVSGLGAALRSSEDADITKAIIWALGEIESPEAVPFLSAPLRDDDGEIRRLSAWALGEIESAEAVEELAGAYSGERVQVVREMIIWALGEIEDPRAAPTLERALQDESQVVRRKAAWALGEIDGMRSAPRGLVDALRDNDMEVRRAAAHALGEIQDVSAVPGLVAALQDADLNMRRIVVHALGEMRSAQAAQALVALLQDPDPEIRRLAAHALGNR